MYVSFSRSTVFRCLFIYFADDDVFCNIFRVLNFYVYVW